MSRQSLPRSSAEPRDTIFALSSGRPPAAISIIRISGADAFRAVGRIAGDLPEPRRAALRRLADPASGDVLDEALVLRFAAPATSTGEDVVELHCHGGRAIVAAVLAALGAEPGLREALPGEFTRRALENGRIDLTQAEGLADLIEAETESQRKNALALAEGGLRTQIEAWREQLVTLSARAELLIDYADDDAGAHDSALEADCGALADDIGAWLERPRAEPLKDGVRIVVAGPPNSGKSSLVNALAGNDRSIVSPLPGTTRDHIEVPLALAGVPVVVTDTAGLRESGDEVEAIGIARARTLVDQADILLWLGDEDAPSHPRVLLVHARADLPERTDVPSGRVAVSAHSGEGLGALVAGIGATCRNLLPTEDAVSLNRRQAALLAVAREAITETFRSGDAAIIGDGLRRARDAFDRISGRAGIEDVLDSLFGRFCLGK